MEISINEKSKTISIWLTNADQHDEACAAQVKALIKEWHGKGWLPVIFRSGGEDLYEDTIALLKHNRDLTARREVEAEKALAGKTQRPSVIQQLHRELPQKSSGMNKAKSAELSR